MSDPLPESSSTPTPSPAVAPAPKRKIWVENLSYALIFVFLAGTVLAVHLIGDVTTSTQSPMLLPFPDRIGLWTGKHVPVSQMEKDVLPADTEISKTLYEHRSGFTLFAVGIISGQESRSIHRPEYCLPGQGWTIAGSDTVTLKSRLNGQPLRVTKLLLEREDHMPDGRPFRRKMIDLYWFEGDGRATPHHWQRVWWTTTDRLFHRLNHRWGFVSVFAEVTGAFHPLGLTEAQTVERMDAFIGELLPKIEPPSPK
ncbi:MAG: EpsI family protein [Verrucomicrobiae bacterium]|nr:EpsI family protein [Verrucomicrobiae bacterium]